MDPETAESIGQTATEHRHCAYCDAPLSIDGSETAPAPSGPRYCCYGCRLLGEAGQKPVALADAKASPWFKIAVGALLSGQSMLLGIAVNLTPPAGAIRLTLHSALILSSLASMAVLGRPLFQSALEAIRQRRISIELLFLTGIGGALGSSLYSTLSGKGNIYYEVVAILLTVYSIGKTLGAQSRARALAETRHLEHRFATCQKISSDGFMRTVRVAEIRPGDQVHVLPGDPIPVDGRITHGEAFVCETPLTGEPFPVVRRPGDEVFAGSYSEDGELRIAATVSGTSRRLDALLSMLETAREQPCRMQAQADSIVRWFLPLVYLTSAGTLFFWTWHSGWAAGWFNALAVLLIACPCAMGLATPVAIWSGLAALAARGLVVRSGDSIERLGCLDTMVFDKTGTLSEESFSLIDIATAGSAEERQSILAQLRAVQSASPHPVARAFHSTLSSPSSPVFRVRSIKTVPALGVEAWLESPSSAEHYLRAGQRELISEHAAEGTLLSKLRHRKGDHLVYIELDGRLAAIAAVRERLRDSANEAIRGLEALGMKCSVMTGDLAEHAEQLLKRNNVQGSLTPLEKAGLIESLTKSSHQVGYAGDGVNDAPAMQQASWSVALAHGAGVTTARADAVLYGGDLRVLPWAVLLSRQVRTSVRSNLLFASAYNILGMALAAAGLLHPVMAALLMVISSFTVSWRALRSTEEVEDCCAIAPTQKPPASRSFNASPWFQTFNGFLIVAQAPFLIYLGQLSTTASAWIAAALLILGVLAARFRTSSPESTRIGHMTIAMLGIGNWGMILGWWADAGFLPATQGCVKCAGLGFSLWHLAETPWMNLGMILFGLPGMLIKPARQLSSLGRVPLGLLAAFGMLWGMHFGNYVLMRWLGQIVPQPFLLSYIGMSVGMLLGMTLCCELGRALSLSLARSKIANN